MSNAAVLALPLPLSSATVPPKSNGILKSAGTKLAKQPNTTANGFLAQNGHQKQQHKSASPAARRRPPNNNSSTAARQLYQRYVGKSQIFAQPSATASCTTRWPPGPQTAAGQYGIGNGNAVTAVRIADSTPTTAQLEWQKRRRVAVRQQAMCAPVGTLNGPKIVQRHAEMRTYLLHCQRVLNARPRVDTGRRSRTPGARSAYSALPSLLSTPANSRGGQENFWMADAIDDIIDGTLLPSTAGTMRPLRARSVPASANNQRSRRRQWALEGQNDYNDQRSKLRAENRQLLERLVQISMRTPPPPLATSANSHIASRQQSSGAASRQMAAAKKQQQAEQLLLPLLR